MVLKIIIPTLFIVIILFLMFRPICVPLSDEDVKRFNPPIEMRMDKNFYIKTFQKKDNQWYRCKTWISRKFFF